MLQVKVRTIQEVFKIDRQAVGNISDLSFVYPNHELECVEIGLLVMEVMVQKRLMKKRKFLSTQLFLFFG